ncbi:AP2 domain transcription factor AP2IV-4 [Besnoitia besnoiti]|uniref:AP2 domain transcription factor AP2IV-4 n=1 Tax=Besnoitia besnoiti TaxID=94643 RepID=A0A2A9MLG2_BESBE|nr:AP2 domain transcription factor AP2IV-4 [Besnoitia besnoiti]PFH36292.1 AP2 domain transcription factor AP2IV-4 [Besnoitia besnoiti]
MATPPTTTEARPAKRRCVPLPQDHPILLGGEGAGKVFQHESFASFSRELCIQQELASVGSGAVGGDLSAAALLKIVQSQNAGGVSNAVLRSLFPSLHQNSSGDWRANVSASTPALSSSTAPVSSSVPGVAGQGAAYGQPSTVGDLIPGGDREHFVSASQRTTLEGSPLLPPWGAAARAAAESAEAPAGSTLPAGSSAPPSTSSLCSTSEVLALAQTALRAMSGGFRAASPQAEESPAPAAGASPQGLSRQSFLQALLLSSAPVGSAAPSLSSVCTASAPASVSRNAGAAHLERMLQQAAAADKSSVVGAPFGGFSQPSTPRRDVLRNSSLFSDATGLSAEDANRGLSTQGTSTSSMTDHGSAGDTTAAGKDEELHAKLGSGTRQEQSSMDSVGLLGLLAALQSSQSSRNRESPSLSHPLLSSTLMGSMPPAAFATSSPSSQCLSSPPSSSCSLMKADPLFSDVLKSAPEATAAQAAAGLSASTLAAFIQRNNAVSGLAGTDFLSQLQGRGFRQAFSSPEASVLPSSLLAVGAEPLRSDGGSGAAAKHPSAPFLQSALRLPSPHQALLETLLASSYASSASTSLPRSDCGEHLISLAPSAVGCLPSASHSGANLGQTRKTGTRVNRQGAGLQNGSGRVRRGRNTQGAGLPQHQTSTDSVVSSSASSTHAGELSSSSHPLDLLRLGSLISGAVKRDMSVQSDETVTVVGEASQRSSSLSRGLTQESLLQLSDGSNSSRESGTPALGPSKAATASSFASESMAALDEDAVVAGALPAPRAHTSSFTPSKPRESRRGGAHGSNAPPPVPLRAEVSLGGNRPHYHVAKQEWRVRYYMNGKRKMRTYSAKFYGYDTAHNMAEDFAHYVDKHEALPDSMMMAAMMLQAQANAAAASGQTVPLSRAVKASAGMTAAAAVQISAAAKNESDSGVEGSASVCDAFDVRPESSEGGEHGAVEQHCLASSACLSSLPDLSSAEATGLAPERVEGEEVVAEASWFQGARKTPSPSDEILCPSAPSADEGGEPEGSGDAIWALQDAAPDQGENGLSGCRVRRADTGSEGEMRKAKDDSVEGKGDLGSGCATERRLSRGKPGAESSLREGQEDMGVTAPSSFQSLSSSRSASLDPLALPRPGDVDTQGLPSAFTGSSACGSLSLASEGAALPSDESTSELPLHSSQHGIQGSASDPSLLSQDACPSTPFPLTNAHRGQNESISLPGDDDADPLLSHHGCLTPEFKDEGEHSRRRSPLCESSNGESSPAQDNPLPTVSFHAPGGSLRHEAATPQKTDTLLADEVEGKTTSVAATAVAATAVSHQIFDTITLFGEFLREFARDKVVQFDEHGFDATPHKPTAVSLRLTGELAQSGSTGLASPRLNSQGCAKGEAGSDGASLPAGGSGLVANEAQFALARDLFPADALECAGETKPRLSSPELLVLSHSLVNLTSSTYVLMHTLKSSLTKSTDQVQLHQSLLERSGEQLEQTAKADGSEDSEGREKPRYPTLSEQVASADLTVTPETRPPLSGLPSFESEELAASSSDAKEEDDMGDSEAASRGSSARDPGLMDVNEAPTRESASSEAAKSGDSESAQVQAARERQGEGDRKKPSVIATALSLLETHQHLASTISQLRGPVSQQLRFILHIAAPQLLPCALPPLASPRDTCDEEGEAPPTSADQQLEDVEGSLAVDEMPSSCGDGDTCKAKRPREDDGAVSRGETQTQGVDHRTSPRASRVLQDEAALERLLLEPFEETQSCSCADKPCPCDRQQVADMVYLLYAIPARQQASRVCPAWEGDSAAAEKDVALRLDTGREEPKAGETLGTMSLPGESCEESRGQLLVRSPDGETAGEASAPVSALRAEGQSAGRRSFSSSSLLAAGRAIASFSSSLAGVPVAGSGGSDGNGCLHLGDLSSVGLLSLSYPAMLAFILPLQSLLHTVSGMILSLHKKLIHRFICAHLQLLLSEDRALDASRERKRRHQMQEEKARKKTNVCSPEGGNSAVVDVAQARTDEAERVEHSFAAPDATSLAQNASGQLPPSALGVSHVKAVPELLSLNYLTEEASARKQGTAPSRGAAAALEDEEGPQKSDEETTSLLLSTTQAPHPGASASFLDGGDGALSPRPSLASEPSALGLQELEQEKAKAFSGLFPPFTSSVSPLAPGREA